MSCIRAGGIVGSSQSRVNDPEQIPLDLEEEISEEVHTEVMMSWHRRVDMRVWGDSRFTQLSPLQPSGQALWIYLLTGPHNDGLPGLFHAGRAGTAEALRWDQEDFDRSWGEIEALGMAEADWASRVILLPNALRYQPPENPNQIKGWATAFDGIPECNLRDRWANALLAQLEARGKTEWIEKGWFNRSRNGSANPSANGSGNSHPHPNPQSQPKEEEGAAAEPAASSLREKRKRWKEEGDEIQKAIVAKGELEQIPARVTLDYLEAWEESARAHYDSHRGDFTSLKRRNVLKALSRDSATKTLAAIEIYVDQYHTLKNESYLVGIARGMARLDKKEWRNQMTKHRNAMKGRGIQAQMRET